MRMMLKVSIPVEKGNETIRDGTMGQKMQAIFADLKPEAVYLVDDQGCRTAMIFFDMVDASEIPAVVEPFMHAFNAGIELHPVMVPEDLGKGMPAAMERLKRYG
jgi:hypothetical protein